MIGNTISLVQILPLFPVSKAQAGRWHRVNDLAADVRKQVGTGSKKLFYI